MIDLYLTTIANYIFGHSDRLHAHFT